MKVGDVARIKAGMSIPCDAILLPGATGVTVDESAMTGESIELKKETPDTCDARKGELEAENPDDKRDNHDVPSPILLSGTQIQTGEGWFLIVVVGKNSCMGKIQEKIG